ncbi:RluA family pseudouridine synthase [Desulfopila inferna]|uniref:RluA family pseudouridine synthase n=1 Tax=Desulfopila inferna TaxID=468528 RepID=UPI00196339F0|nr:RluA family pseudouridine synthase [Desulfopila inferna]MBM9605294.1 RluA family pseudouridine synthase [Desulfopila inferna]
MKDARPRSRAKTAKKKNTEYIVEKKETLLVSLLSHLPHKSRNILKAVLKDRQVSVDGKPVTQFDYALVPGQRVEVSWTRAVPVQQPRELNIIFEDENIIVINKPAGLLTVATDKEKRKTAYSMLSDYVKKENSENKIFVIHRLDRETSGLLMFARNEKIKEQIQENWGSTVSQRTYVGVVEGRIEQPEGTISSWLTESKAFIVYSSQNPQSGKKAITHYKTLKANNTYTMLQINLETGRKHQIRVHMQDMKHPIIGDKKYGSSDNPLRRLGLHAQVLAFVHPSTGEPCRFETGIPEKFQQLFSA